MQKIEPDSNVNEKKDRDYKPHGIISRQQIKPPPEKFSRRSKRFSGQEEKQEVSIKQEDCKEECDSDNDCKDGIRNKQYDDKDNSKELKKLQFYGPGPKMAGFNTKEGKKSNKTRGVKLIYEVDPVSVYHMLFSYDLYLYNLFSLSSCVYFSSWQSIFVTIAEEVIMKKACFYVMDVMIVIILFVLCHL